jgi:hypothetical protein
MHYRGRYRRSHDRLPAHGRRLRAVDRHVDAQGYDVGLLRCADLRLAIATDGKRINLPGGLPIIVDGHVVGAIGIGSGTGAQDLECAKAALATLDGAQQF